MRRKDEGDIKLLAYRKSAHTDQYLDLNSRYPLYYKLGIVKILLDRCVSLVTEEGDRMKEENHIRKELSKCGYPNWTIEKVKDLVKTKNFRENGSKKRRPHHRGQED